MLTLGIDPGTAIVGYGLVRELHDGSLQAVSYGVITTDSQMPMPLRLKAIFDSLSHLVKEYQPERAAVEELFFAKNAKTAITVAQGRGVILLALTQAQLPIAEYKPKEVKQAVSGYGSANKLQMQEMTRLLLGLESTPRPDDAADALAIAITDLHTVRYTLY